MSSWLSYQDYPEQLTFLPAGIFYAQGVKANVLFDRKPGAEEPRRKRVSGIWKR